jgi:Ca-activated chloride channel homolog
MKTLAAAALLGAAAFPLAQQRATYRAQNETVEIYATVRDASGRLAADLSRGDFQVLDNGKPVELTVFSRDIQPLTVALLLDMSGSMVPRYLRVRESTLNFIDALLPQDRVRIGTFGAEVSLSPILTSDRDVLRRIAREELWPGGGTPMWSAMFEGIVSLADEQGRRVLLVLTDGQDTGPLEGMPKRESEAKRRAIREGFMVYAIGMQGYGLDEEIVGLTDETGGGHHEIRSDDDVGATFLQIAEELRRQYVLGFSPAVADGKEHRLEVRLSKPGLTARARRSYVASKGK